MTGAPIGDALRQLGRLFSGASVAGRSDAALLRQFVVARDEEAFAVLVARHGPMVLAVCRGSLRDPRDAEDAFQATFLVLVRRAGSIWVDESLGGWLYRVARRVARRANVEAIKRGARERRGVEMDAIAGRDGDERGRAEAALHEEIARLPEAMRRAVVLCELEGLTQPEAARLLHCGEATVRRRLAGARERLRARLAGQGVASSALAALLRPAIVPNGWAEATVRAAMASGRAATSAARLAASVAGSMVRARRLRVAALAVVGLASAWGVGAAQQGKGEVAKPTQVPTAKVATPAPKWAHLTSDAGYEAWVRLEDGRALWKSEQYAGLRDPASGTELNYRGQGPIERRPDIVGVTKDGRPDVAFALERAGVGLLVNPPTEPHKATDEERRFERGNVFFEAAIEDLDGRRCLRKDRYTPDSLGKARMDEQVWYDLETRRPGRRREILQLAYQQQYKREYRTTTITYVDAGPADLYALGVPAGTPIVDAATLNKVEIPPDLQRAFDGAARAMERLPRSCRIMDDGDYCLQMTYWSAPEDYLPAWAAFVRNHSDTSLYAVGPTRSFYADHQGHGAPGDPRDQEVGQKADFPADRLVAWLPLDQAVNMHLHDGKRAFDLTRFVTEPGKPRRVQVHVYRDGSASLPAEPLKMIWPFAFDNRRNLTLVPPEPGTPPGWVAIRVDYGQIRYLYYADPAHDFAVTRKVEWSDLGAMKFRKESKAVRWERSPGGTWYVSAWEVLHHLDQFDAQGKLKAEQQADSTSIQRVAITPMDPEKFPPGIFDGEKLLEAARKEGATIKVD